MGGKSDKTQTVTNIQQLPPEISQLLRMFTGEIGSVADSTKGMQITPDFSSETLRGLNLMKNQFKNNPGMDFMNSTVKGDYLNSNPYTMANSATGLNSFAGLSNQSSRMNNGAAGLFNNYSSGVNTATGLNPYANVANSQMGANNQYADLLNDQVGESDLSGVTDSITQAATQAVGDRFSQAGRGGSNGEGFNLAGEVARKIAPYEFSANEAQLARNFTGGENRINRMVGAEESRLGRDFAGGENQANRLFSAGADQLGRQFGANENRIDRMTGAGADQINRMFGANESQINRMTGADESQIARLFGAGESQLSRLFAGNESALGRGFSGYEAERGRQQSILPMLFSAQGQNIQNMLGAGQMIEGHQRDQAMDPFTRLQMLMGPFSAAMGGSPMNSSTSKPLSRSVAGSILGGGLGGAQLASMMGFGGPMGGILGGLLGLFG